SFYSRSRFINAGSKEKLDFSNFILNNDKENIRAATAEEKNLFNLNEEYLVCPFEMVPDLLGRRSLYLKDGNAYISKFDVFSIIQTKFKESLEFQMDLCSRYLPTIKDERVIPILDHVKASRIVAPQTASNFTGTKVGADD